MNEAMEAVYAKPKSATEYERIAQTMEYDSERAMYESYSKNKYTSTGVIQWMLNNAWPSMIWHLYDYYLDTGGGYFGAKKACEPLHVQYSYDDHSVYVVNSTYQPSPHLTVSARAYDSSLKEVFTKESQLEVTADSSTNALTIPPSVFSASSPITFVELTLKDSKGQIVSRNFYWVPAKLTTWNWPKTDYTHTPALEHEDLTALRNLPQTRIEASAKTDAQGVVVHLHNPSKTLAFQIAVAATGPDGQNIVPTLWSDNYIDLMPGESATLSATLPKHAQQDYSIVVSGWNAATITLHPVGETRTVAGVSH
jgi:exo-1,4-beta-D-glucosaminidase